MTTFRTVTLADWRAQVEKDLAGASFDKTLVHKTAEGLSILPLYTELPASGALDIDCGRAPFRICMRHDAGTSAGAVEEDVEGGVDALWLRSPDLLAHVDPARTFLVLDVDDGSPSDALAKLANLERATPFALTLDPYGLLARGHIAAADLPARHAAMVEAARRTESRFPAATVAMASTLPYHDAGADDADELALGLATGTAYLRELTRSGLDVAAAARQIALQVAVGRDTFAELCKVRALRVCWTKVLVAAGAPVGTSTLIHAVCSSRTVTQRDPWVNMLRVTTQIFGAVLGGADLVTPATFDQALGSPSALARRIGRNTGLVLREESHLGRVVDPAGGSYYLETLTDALAREAWKRFQTIEREGGVADALVSGRVQLRLEAAWRTQLEQVAKRRVAILGVSEFANLSETVPGEPAPATAKTTPTAGLPVHRDAEIFERLRDHASALPSAPDARLIALGPLAESRPRVGFASSFFTAGGFQPREATLGYVGEGQVGNVSPIACICGSDERYAAEAADCARTLKAGGTRRVLLAGRPGALEASLREAGVDGFIFVGCDVAAMLGELQEVSHVPA